MKIIEVNVPKYEMKSVKVGDTKKKVYVADDGSEHQTQSLCERYEKGLRLDEQIKTIEFSKIKLSNCDFACAYVRMEFESHADNSSLYRWTPSKNKEDLSKEKYLIRDYIKFKEDVDIGLEIFKGIDLSEEIIMVFWTEIIDGGYETNRYNAVTFKQFETTIEKFYSTFKNIVKNEK